jgi:hypothetical protein
VLEGGVRTEEPGVSTGSSYLVIYYVSIRFFVFRKLYKLNSKFVGVLTDRQTEDYWGLASPIVFCDGDENEESRLLGCDTVRSGRFGELM